MGVLEVGPERVEAECVHSGELCPGAPWQELAYDEQLKIKAGQVRDSLERIGSLEGFELEPVIQADEIWRYRNKLEYSFGTGSDGSLALGFHRRGNWREVVDIEDCLLASELSNEIRNFIRGHFQGHSLEAYDRESGTGLLRNLVVREGRNSRQIHVRLVTSDASGTGFNADQFATAVRERFDTVSGIVWTVNSGSAEASQGELNDLLYGVEWFEELVLFVLGEVVELSEGFFRFETDGVAVDRGHDADGALVGDGVGGVDGSSGEEGGGAEDVRHSLPGGPSGDGRK